MSVSQQWGSSKHHDIDVAFQSGVTVIQLRGEVDMAMCEALDAVASLAIEYGAPVRVDLGQVSFIDSSGLAFLARLAAQGHERGWVPALSGASVLVRQVIELSGLLPVLDVDSPATD